MVAWGTTFPVSYTSTLPADELAIVAKTKTYAGRYPAGKVNAVEPHVPDFIKPLK